MPGLWKQPKEEDSYPHQKSNGRLPCPMDGHRRPDAAGYGMENCVGTLIGGAGIHVGALPIVDLELPDEVMLDGWNRRFTYVVDDAFVLVVDRATTGMLGRGGKTCLFHVPLGNFQVLINGHVDSPRWIILCFKLS